MATDAEILVTREALNAALADIPDLSGVAFRMNRRSIVHLIAPDAGWDVSGQTVRLARTAHSVSLALEGLARTVDGSGYVTVLNLPVGFRPTNDQWATATGGQRIRITSTTGQVAVWAPTTSTNLYATLNFPTDDAPPAELP